MLSDLQTVKLDQHIQIGRTLLLTHMNCAVGPSPQMQKCEQTNGPGKCKNSA